MLKLSLSSALLAFATFAFAQGQTTVGVFGTVGAADRGSLQTRSNRAPTMGGGFQGRWRINSKWFLNGEIAFRSVQQLEAAPICYECITTSIRVHNQTSIPARVGYYLSKADAHTRLWIGLGAELENTVNLFPKSTLGIHLPTTYFKGVYMQNSIGVDFKFLTFKSQAAFYLNTNIWQEGTLISIDIHDRVSVYKRSFRGAPTLRNGALQARWMVIIPIQSELDLQIGLDAVAKAHSVNLYSRMPGELFFDRPGFSYLGVNLGMQWKLN